MISPELLRSLLPQQNPLAFSAADYIFLGLALLFVFAFTAGAASLKATESLAERRIWSGVFLFLFPIVARLALLARHPLPIPRVADDFSYVLLADTLAHFRLANVTHPMHRFFEAVFVLQEPSYSSIYPVGHGAMLAIGQLLFGHPWAGVLISSGLLAACCYWMLLAWVPAAWAFAGGIITALQFGPLSPWMNTYWGGATSAIAGCLIFGAVNRRGVWAGIALGAGLGLQLLTRPYEFVLVAPVALVFAFSTRFSNERSSRLRYGAAGMSLCAGVLLLAAGVMMLHDRAVTGNWFMMPYQLSRFEYGIPATFTTQSNPVPHRPLTIEQKVDYEAQVAVHGPGTDTVRSYLKRLLTRIRFYRFFYFPALYFSLPAIAFVLWHRRFIPVLLTLAVLWIGDGFYPYFYPHYVAVATCLFVLLAIESLRRIVQFRGGPQIVAVLLVLAGAHFVYSLTAGGATDHWNGLNPPDPEGRASVETKLESTPGQHLVFVRYAAANHRAQEWIHNSANIDAARIIWAVDLGDQENTALRAWYANRHFWLLEPDAQPLRLSQY